MIIREPKTLDSFIRCECHYKLLEFDNGRAAIEWDAWTSGDPPYAIMYDDPHEATKDFNNLLAKRTYYWQIEARTKKEDILNVCPWLEEGKEIARIDEDAIGAFWVIIEDEHSRTVKIGPHEDIISAVRCLSENILRYRGD